MYSKYKKWRNHKRGLPNGYVKKHTELGKLQMCFLVLVLFFDLCNNRKDLNLERNFEMKDNSTKTILVLLLIVIILGCILVFKILNGNSNGHKKTHTAKLNYSKTEIIDLIKSESNKSNYEVEYTLNDNKYKKNGL